MSNSLLSTTRRSGVSSFQVHKLKLPPLRSTPENEGAYVFDFDFETGFVVKKRKNGEWKKSDGRDKLPFQVFAEQDLPKEESQNAKGSKKAQTNFLDIGTYYLDSSTSCGDLLDLGPKKGRWLVNRVKFLYEWRNGRYNVIKKKLDVVAAKPPFFDEGEVLQ